jgi:hypothetical protein
VTTVVSDSDHGADESRPGETSVDYERAVTQASELVLAHLKACPEDVKLSRERHEEGRTLYEAVRATFPEIERMRLTSLMWDQVAGQALTVFESDRDDHARESDTAGEGGAGGKGGAGEKSEAGAESAKGRKGDTRHGGE